MAINLSHMNSSFILTSLYWLRIPNNFKRGHKISNISLKGTQIYSLLYLSVVIVYLKLNLEIFLKNVLIKNNSREGNLILTEEYSFFHIFSHFCAIILTGIVNWHLYPYWHVQHSHRVPHEEMVITSPP